MSRVATNLTESPSAQSNENHVRQDMIPDIIGMYIRVSEVIWFSPGFTTVSKVKHRESQGLATVLTDPTAGGMRM